MLKVPRKLSISSSISPFSTTFSAWNSQRVYPLQHLTENEKKLVEKVKNFAVTTVKPLVREMDKNAKLDKDLLKEAFKLKLMGLEVDEKYGGSGSSFFEVMLTVEEISKIDPAVALTIHLQNALIAPMLTEYGNEEQKERYLKRVCTDSDDNLGMRAGATSQVHFNNVRVPKSAILGEYGKGYKYAIDILNASRILIGAQMIGLAQGCFDQTIPYLRERKQFGNRLIDFQGIQHQISKIGTEIEAARLMVYNSARMKDCGLPFIKAASMAKYYAPEVACETSKKCIEWLGGIGFTKKFFAEKFYRDAVVGGIYEGTSNIQLNTIAKFIDNEYKNKI